jgi:hypothetical protein
MEESEIKTGDLEFSELKIEKYPMANSPNFIEYFLIMGYEESFIEEKIIKNINIQIESKQSEQLDDNNKNKKTNINEIQEFRCRQLPTILFSINSNFSGILARENVLIKNVFPIPPTIFISSQKNYIYEPNQINVIFTNIHNDVVNIGYSFIFYEKYYASNKSNIFVPKAFVIVSQYPFFNTFNGICKELLYNQFKNELLEIPIELQLYNIINFIPAPVKEGLNFTFFPLYDLSEIIECKSDKELIDFKEQKVYNLSQLSGHRPSEIDFSVLFCLLPIDYIVQIYLQLLIGNIIAFFSKNIEILNITIYIFQQFFYPLIYDETINTFSPSKYFCSEFCTQNIIGFLCSYDEINNYDPFRELKENEYKFLSENEEKEVYYQNILNCNYIVDLDKSIFKENDNLKEDVINLDKQKNNNNEIFNFISNILNENSISDNSTELEKSINKLVVSLKKVKNKLNYSDKSKRMPSFINNNTKYNDYIQECFYKFNIEISYLHYKYVSKYNGNYKISKNGQINSKIKTAEEAELKKMDYIFLKKFSETLYCNVLNNIVGGYSNMEPVLYKAPRIIFEIFISLKKILNNKMANNSNSINFTKNLFKIIDNIYMNKSKGNEKIKEKNITFLNFYKFYNDNLKKIIYNFVDNKYVDVKIDKTDENNLKYYYKYKRIELDKNLLMEYVYMIQEMTQKEMKDIFNIEKDSYLIYKPINENITTINIYNIIENYYINSNYIGYKDIIILSVINIVAISIQKKTLIPFTISLYYLFEKIYISCRKLTEIILSISYRLFTKDKEQNIALYEKYFNLYTITIDNNFLFPNDQLIYLKNKIDNINVKDKNRDKEVLYNKKFKKIEGIENEKLYSLESQKKYKEMINILEDNNLEGTIKNKIIFKSKYIKSKIITYYDVYSPKMLYFISNDLLQRYYETLEFSQINKYQYEKILICLLFYLKISDILEFDLVKDINKFLFYCLVVDEL